MMRPPELATDRFAHIPDVVLGPLHGRTAADWQRAPAGKWTPAQIVHHLAISLDSSARAFETRRAKPPMQRRRRTARELLGYWLVFGLGRTVPGREAPAAVRPAERPEPAAVERQLREGVERFLVLGRTLLPDRRADLFVKNPALGDLTLPEWLRFHVWHCAHHARQIRARLAS
jgi:DinB superfamily